MLDVEYRLNTENNDCSLRISNSARRKIDQAKLVFRSNNLKR